MQHKLNCIASLHTQSAPYPMVIVHSIIGQLCLRGRCVGGIHDTYISVHTPCYRCVCKNWHCARVTRPQPARYRATRGPSTALPPPRLPLVPQKYHPQDLSLSFSLLFRDYASSVLGYLRRSSLSPCHPSPDNVLRFSFSFFFFFLVFLSFLVFCT